MKPNIKHAGNANISGTPASPRYSINGKLSPIWTGKEGHPPLIFILTILIRYGGDWHGDSLDLLVEALGPRLTKLQLHYVENFDLAAIATVAHCCQGLKSLEVAALVGSRYVGEGYEEEPYIAQIRRMEEAEVGNLSGSFQI